MKRFLMCGLPILALLVLLSAAPALAGQAQATITVSATVAANCTISSTNISFGSYDPIGTNNGTTGTDLDAQGSVTIRCTKGTGPTIGLDAGQNFTTTRRMAGGGEFLNYEIYKEAARTNVWGNSGAALINHTPTGPPNAQTYPTYGRVPRGQDVTPATYTDSVVATVIF